VVSIDKERRGTKGDVIWRRDACKTVDNMMRVRMQEGILGRPQWTLECGSITCGPVFRSGRPGITDEAVVQ
jgi:hypothetical protein